MDWNDFFERTRQAAGVDSYSKLAPMLGITDGAIGHYRMGRRVPQVWVVADALRIQGHPTPEKAAIEIMKKAALTSPERAFWKKLAGTAAALLCAITLALGASPSSATAKDLQARAGNDFSAMQIMSPGNVAYVANTWRVTTSACLASLDQLSAWAQLAPAPQLRYL